MTGPDSPVRQCANTRASGLLTTSHSSSLDASEVGRGAHGPLPARAAAALLPDPWAGAGRRGRGTGDAPLRVERIGVIRRALDAALLAVSDRYQPLSEHAAR